MNEHLAEKTIELLNDQIAKLVMRGDISQTEIDALKDAWEIELMIAKLRKMHAETETEHEHMK